MRSLILLAAVSLPLSAHAQVGQVQVLGPYQPVYPGVYAPTYIGPYYRSPYYAAPYYRGGYYGGRAWLDAERNYELRQIRYELEDANFQRRWRR